MGSKHWTKLVAVAVIACGAVTMAQAAERRCGWYSNPTPGNLWLTDKDASWTITSQGEGPDAAGAEKAPDFDPKQFVETNVPGSGHGYGYACMTVETDVKDQRITRVIAGNILPLAKCKADKSLPPPS
ncbi:DUF4087 domain-containing protein [Mesorhizobium sp. IMUNJ 23232]|uniref:DUF4087 domain-containing protein n=1 Tax=Mesorhizobium sp. IMUNJ 23232 TaxID=3376064 RepID=UPI00379A74DB